MRRTSAALAAVLTTLLMVAAAPAQADRRDTWTTLSSPGVSNLTEPGMYRTADGTLHVAILGSSGITDSIEVAHISRAGKPTGLSPAVTGWQSLTDDPELVPTPGGGMRMVFGGIRTSDSSDPLSKGYIYYASSDATGVPWLTDPGSPPAVASPSGYGSYGTGATTLADGTLVTAYPFSSTITYQVGSGPLQSFDVAACCALDVSLVNDGGTVWAAWYANGSAPGTYGTFVRTIYPSLGPVLQAPDSSTGSGSLGTGQAVALAARTGGGVYVAYLKGYPTARAVALWRVGKPEPMLVEHSRSAQNVALSAGPHGRLWLAYDEGHSQVEVVHTDPAAKTFGAVQLLRTPRNSSVYAVNVEGSDGPADVVFNNGSAILHHRTYYRLSVTANPSRIQAGRTNKVTFTVTNAGDPVKGARVKARGRSCKTDGKGRCVLTIPLPIKPFDAVAERQGYAAGEVHVKIRR